MQSNVVTGMNEVSMLCPYPTGKGYRIANGLMAVVKRNSILC